MKFATIENIGGHIEAALRENLAKQLEAVQPHNLLEKFDYF
jgi:hypothetical protein